MKKVVINGKAIDLSKVAEKTEAQFRDQIRRNGIELTDEQFAALWEHIQKQVKREAEKAAKEKEA